MISHSTSENCQGVVVREFKDNHTNDEVVVLIKCLLAANRTVPIRVTGGSMRPTLRNGEIVYLRPITSLRVGQVVAVQKKDACVIHRVVRIAGAYVWTQGDSNPEVDTEVMITDVIAEQVPPCMSKLVCRYLMRLIFRASAIMGIRL